MSACGTDRNWENYGFLLQALQASPQAKMVLGGPKASLVKTSSFFLPERCVANTSPFSRPFNLDGTSLHIELGLMRGHCQHLSANWANFGAGPNRFWHEQGNVMERLGKSQNTKFSCGWHRPVGWWTLHGIDQLSQAKVWELELDCPFWRVKRAGIRCRRACQGRHGLLFCALQTLVQNDTKGVRW